MPDFFDNRRPHEGLTYDAYTEAWEEKLKRSMAELSADERRYQHYARYNWERAEAVEQEYMASEELREVMNTIDTPQLWMVLTDDWCGDSAFSLPIIARAASLSDHVTLRILRRDDNLDIMDQYLTDGSRSVPKLVAFSEDGDELFEWGPRPADAAALREGLIAEGAEGKDVVEPLITWYEDGGYEDVEEELIDRLTSSLPVKQ
jgi:hypothetical protein